MTTRGAGPYDRHPAAPRPVGIQHAHTLAGRTEGVELDEKGTRQAAELVGRLDGLPIRALVRSPLLRCRLTLEPLATAQRVSIR